MQIKESLIQIDGDLEMAISRIENLIRNNSLNHLPQFKDGVVSDWNENFERIYGYRAADILGKRLKDFLRSKEEAQRFENTIKKNIKDNLEKSPEWFRAIADYACGLESWHGIDGCLLWVNQGVKDFTGFSADECMNMQDYPLPFVHEDDRMFIKDALTEALTLKTSEDSLPFRIVRKDNSMRWVEISWKPVYSSAKAYLGIRSSIRDISLQKLAEESLQDSEQKYRSLINDVLDASAAAICILDRNFKIIWVNSAFERYFGINRSKIIGQNSKELINNKLKNIFEKPEVFAKTILESYDKNIHSERFECHILTGPHRQERWLEHRSNPVNSGVYAGGRIEHYYDITLRKYAEKNMHESKQMLQLVLNSIPVRVFWKDVNSVYLGCNKAFAKDMGFNSQQDIIGKNDSELFGKPEEADSFMQFDEQVIKSGAPEYKIIQRYCRLSDSAEVWREISKIPFRDSEGKITGLLGTYEDITSRKLTEEEIRSLNRELEQRVAKRTAELTKAHRHLLREIKERKALEKEILDISEREKRHIGQELHDSIGQQLMGTSFLSKVLEGKLDSKLPEEAASAKAITDLVNKTLDQTRGLARGLHPVDLNGGTFISAVQQLLGSMERLFNVKCLLKSENSIMIEDANLAVNLYRIIQEAITNAVKHGKAKNIDVELNDNGDRAFLIIKNDGRSFPENTGCNSGMGLRIMDHRAEMIGGSLNVRKNITGGTVVTCCFPNNKSKD